MAGLIEIVADFVLSIISKKTNAVLARGKRRIAHALIALFLLIVFGMGSYAVYSLSKMILHK
jgi:hypothetical protein